MNRTAFNFWLDTFLLVLFVTLLANSVVLHYVFPPGEQATWALWGWGYHEFAQFEFGLVWIMTLAIALHLIMHWSWVCHVAARWSPWAKKNHYDNQTITMVGVGFLILLGNVFGAFVAIALAMVEKP